MDTHRDDFPRFPCPVCNGTTEITPSGALTCRRYGSDHYRVPWDYDKGRPAHGATDPR